MRVARVSGTAVQGINIIRFLSLRRFERMISIDTRYFPAKGENILEEDDVQDDDDEWEGEKNEEGNS